MLSSTARSVLVGLAACLALAVAPAGASAAAGTGAVTLGVSGKGKAAKALTAARVKTSAIKPAARRRGGRIALPVGSLTVGKSATVSLRGGITFRAGERRARLKSVRLILGSRRASISVKLGKARRTFFSASLPAGRSKLDSSKLTAALSGGKLGLTRAGAKLLRSKLGVPGIVAGALGGLTVDARRAGGAGGGGGGGKPGGGGPGGGGGPTAGPIKNEPPMLARPAGAVDVTSASLTWRPRVSWLCYIEETSVFGGAANGPTESLACSGGPRDLAATFTSFPFKSGWYHPATGTAAIYFQGGVGFRYPSHGIDFSSANPEIEINGGSSRAIFTFNGSEGTKYDNQRGVLVDLHPDPIQAPPNGTVVYTDVPATVPADAGASVFAGFYGANDPFGSLSVSFTAP